MPRPIASFQLSGRGYRDRPSLLDPALSLFASGTGADFLRYSEMYSSLAASHLVGVAVYGPQNQGPKNKNARDVHERFEALMERVESVPEPFMSLEDLKTCRDWKMVRNRVRQNWLLVNENSDSVVKKVTSSAFSELDDGDWEAAMSTLTKGLAGVGPATASIILTLRDPKVPFFGEEVIRVCGLKDKSYNERSYREFSDLMAEKARELDVELTPRDMERAVWAAVYQGSKDDHNAEEQPSAKKRKKNK